MKRFTHVKLSGLFLAGLCLVSVFALGTGSASARPQLLFVPTGGHYPYHLVGSSSKEAVLATTGGTSIKSPSQHALVLVLNSSLFNARIEFLKVTSSLGGKCATAGTTPETIVINLLGHLGLIDPGLEPGVLLLVPAGFEFECTGTSLGNIKIKVSGQVIGLISAPTVGVASELLTVKFEQTSGQQRWKTFLLWNEQLTNQHLTSTIPIFGEEESGQSGEATLHALPGEGTFKIILDP